jgi:hypothetical protein
MEAFPVPGARLASFVRHCAAKEDSPAALLFQ